MGYLELLESINNELTSSEFVDDTEAINKYQSFDYYLNLPLSEIKKRDIAFQIYSEYLGDAFWICSNEIMIEQIKNDDPKSVIYHIDEVMRIKILKPDIKALESIHKSKKTFKNSQIKA